VKYSTSVTAAVAVFAVAVAFSSCGGAEAQLSAESPSDDTTTTVVSEQSLNTTTTLAVAVAETSDEANKASDRVGDRASVVTTTTAPVPSEPAASDDALVLSRYGVGDHRFGDDADEVINSLAVLFGLPSTDVTRRYRENESGVFVDRNNDFVFLDLFGRETCFDSGFCVESAGEVDNQMVFSGWTLRQGTGALTTNGGIGIGSRWSAFTSVMTVEPVGCGMYSTGVYRGMNLEVRSLAEPFSSDEDIITDPEKIVVTAMSAGDIRLSLHPAC